MSRLLGSLRMNFLVMLRSRLFFMGVLQAVIVGVCIAALAPAAWLGWVLALWQLRAPRRRYFSLGRDHKAPSCRGLVASPLAAWPQARSQLPRPRKLHRHYISLGYSL